MNDIPDTTEANTNKFYHRPSIRGIVASTHMKYEVAFQQI